MDTENVSSSPIRADVSTTTPAAEAVAAGTFQDSTQDTVVDTSAFGPVVTTEKNEAGNDVIDLTGCDSPLAIHSTDVASEHVTEVVPGAGTASTDVSPIRNNRMTPTFETALPQLSGTTTSVGEFITSAPSGLKTMAFAEGTASEWNVVSYTPEASDGLAFRHESSNRSAAAPTLLIRQPDPTNQRWGEEIPRSTTAEMLIRQRHSFTTLLGKEGDKITNNTNTRTYCAQSTAADGGLSTPNSSIANDLDLSRRSIVKSGVATPSNEPQSILKLRLESRGPAIGSTTTSGMMMTPSIGNGDAHVGCRQDFINPLAINEAITEHAPPPTPIPAALACQLNGSELATDHRFDVAAHKYNPAIRPKPHLLPPAETNESNTSQPAPPRSAPATAAIDANAPVKAPVIAAPTEVPRDLLIPSEAHSESDEKVTSAPADSCKPMVDPGMVPVSEFHFPWNDPTEWQKHFSYLMGQLRTGKLFDNSVDDEHRNSLVHCAAACNAVPELNELLTRSDACLNTYNEYVERATICKREWRGSYTPLCVAAFYGCEEAILCLLEHGADAHKPVLCNGKFATTALSFAIEKQLRRAVVKLLPGMDPNEGLPLHTAVGLPNTDMEIVRILLQAGANPCLFASEQKDTALHIAAEAGNADVIEALLTYIAEGSETGVNEDLLYRLNSNKELALHIAAERGHVEAFKYLASKMSDVGLQTENKKKETFLHLAAWKKQVSIVKACLEMRLHEKVPALVNLREKTGRTPLYMAVIAALSGKDNKEDSPGVAVVETLLQMGADVHAHSDIKDTPWSLVQKVAGGHIMTQLRTLFERREESTGSCDRPHRLAAVAAQREKTADVECSATAVPPQRGVRRGRPVGSKRKRQRVDDVDPSVADPTRAESRNVRPRLEVNSDEMHHEAGSDTELEGAYTDTLSSPYGRDASTSPRPIQDSRAQEQDESWLTALSDAPSDGMRAAHFRIPVTTEEEVHKVTVVNATPDSE